MPYRIQRSVTAARSEAASVSAPATVVFTSSGDMDSEHVEELARLIAGEPRGSVAVDMGQVTFVDRAAVGVLARLLADGVQLFSCPAYVRSWVAAEAHRGGKTT